MSDQLGRVWMAEIERIHAPQRQMMDDAARRVMKLGYQPSDCLLQTLRGTDRLDTQSVEIHRLLVLGEPCFEVAVTRSAFFGYKCTYTTTPRLIAWPPNKVAHQVQRPSPDEA